MNECPNCGNAMRPNAKSCSCGWEISGSNQSRPPEALSSLVDEIRRIGMPRIGLPGNSAIEVARYWLTMNEPADERYESPREVPAVGKDGSRWVCPYHQRLIATLRAFALMSELDRRIVTAGVREEKVWWRGDPVKSYLNIIDETKRMRRVGIEAYRGDTAAEVKKVFPGLDLEAKLERQAIMAESEK